MTATQEKLPEIIEIWTDCPGCGGSGMVEEHNKVITKAAMPNHIANHAYTPIPRTRDVIGANCDCPRKAIVVKHPCVRCGGKTDGRVLRRVPIPKKNSKVVVLDKKLLTSIFGAGEEPDEPGTVYDAQTSEEHMLELQTGIGVRVTWDRLTKYGQIPKGKEVELWTFDLLELKPA